MQALDGQGQRDARKGIDDEELLHAAGQVEVPDVAPKRLDVESLAQAKLRMKQGKYIDRE